MASPTHGLREIKRAQTEAALVAAAYELVGEGGLAAVTADAIADRAGVSRRTFFNYFPSVESVLVRGLTDLFTQVSTRIAECATQDLSLLDSLEALATAPGEQLMLEHLARLGVLGSGDPHAVAILHAAKSGWVDWLADFIHTRTPAGSDELYAVGLANGVVAAAHAAITVWMQRTGGSLSEESVAQLRALLTQSLSAVRRGFDSATCPVLTTN